MVIDLAFSETGDGRFIALCKVDPDKSNPAVHSPLVFTFDSENPFLEKLVAANLPHGELVAVTTNVLLSISKPVFPPRWTSIEIDALQLATLGLSTHRRWTDVDPLIEPAGTKFPIWNFETVKHFHEFLMQAPTPFVMLKGPDHVLTFINPPYVELMGRDFNSRLVGRPIRECLPELEGQPFFGLLDEVYRTGVPFVGKEILARLQNQMTGKFSERYFDFVYHPTHDSSGEVLGIFVQAIDVTERVLARHVIESREEKLYRQWAELDTMYRTAPVGMCLIDVKEYRVLRMNDKLASLAGVSAEALLGQKITDIFPGSAPQREEQFRKVVAGHYVRNFEIAISVPTMPGLLRQWLLNFGPLFSASGEVEAIACVSLEITDHMLLGENTDCAGAPLPQTSGTQR